MGKATGIGIAVLALLATLSACAPYYDRYDRYGHYYGSRGQYSDRYRHNDPNYSGSYDRDYYRDRY